MDNIYRRARQFARTKRPPHKSKIIGNNEGGGEEEEDEHKKKKKNNEEETTTPNNNNNNNSKLRDGSLYDCLTPATRIRLNTLAQIGEDWLYLALLGIIMALLSLSMDSVITIFLETRIWLSEEAREQNLVFQYLAWCITPILLVTFSTGFVHLCSPTAIGSGIPEMKTILRGVVLNEYLTFRTLIAKIVGLTFTLGSGLPLGKEGPSVHMASIVATLLSKLVASFQGIYENESRTSEMLSAACAVGVAATFYAPIGGVLFSIEVTTVYFAVRNYWRGFFAACCGATIWRLLGFYIQNDESVSAIFKTNFATDYPFEPVELLVFSFIGATCGLAGAAYIKFHREIVQFFRRHKRISGFLQQNRFVYPTLVTLIITTSTFPPLLGQYTASTLSTHTTIEHLFSNRTWSAGAQDLVSKRILNEWTTPDTNFYLHLVLYILMLFWTSALASTIPTPSGVFIPVVKMGAAYGRLIGELMAAAYPHGIKYSHPAFIVPGSYAVVGAAAFSGAVTHTVSTSVILFEMTGQIVHIIPVILGVLISNAVCQSLQPSIYDSIIEIKKLPYLPPIASSNSISHRILVKDFMNRNMPFVWKHRCTYANLKSLLSTNRKIISFPLVESPHSMKLLGSVARPDLLKLLYLHLGRERRLQEVCRRNSDTLTPALHLLTTISGNHVNDSVPGSHLAAPPYLQLTPPEGGGGGGGGGSSSTRSGNVDCGIQINMMMDDDGPRQDQRSRPLDVTGSATTQHNNDDCDARRLIISATTATHNYGATEAAAGAPSTTSSGDRKNLQQQQKNSLGEEQLLSDCQKGLLAHEQLEYKQFNSVAKLVNRYDEGSSMDQDQLDKSIQEVEGHLAKVTLDQKPAEIVLLVSSSNVDQPTTNSGGGGGGAIFKNDSGSSLSSDSESATNQVRTVESLPIPIGTRTTIQVPSKRTKLNQASSFSHVPLPVSPSLSSRPTKSILKTSSFSNNLTKRMISPALSFNNSTTTNNYDFVNNNNTRTMNNIKFTLAPNNSEHLTKLNNHAFLMETGASGSGSGLVDYNEQQQTTRQRRKVRLPRLRVVDMTPEEQEQWEKEQLNAYIDISKCQIDEAPFQLVEQTSLYRVHTLFSMLGLNHAYVTSFGRLVGIVALKDIRRALEKMLQET